MVRASGKRWRWRGQFPSPPRARGGEKPIAAASIGVSFPSTFITIIIIIIIFIIIIIIIITIFFPLIYNKFPFFYINGQEEEEEESKEKKLPVDIHKFLRENWAGRGGPPPPPHLLLISIRFRFIPQWLSMEKGN